jgi:hypothetical protein
MRYIYPIAALICLASASAQAATCESSFVKGGNPLTGLRFTAQVALPGLTPASAIGQVRGMVQAKGYDVLATEAEGGSMLIEQPQVGKTSGFPITIVERHIGAVLRHADISAVAVRPGRGEDMRVIDRHDSRGSPVRKVG